MPSFEEIMKRPASEFQPPEPIPAGTYHCLVEGIPEHVKVGQKQTDAFKVVFKIVSPWHDVNPAEAAEAQVVGKTIFSNYFITEGATYRFSELLEHLDVDTKLPIEQAVSYMQGKQCMVRVKHEMSQDGKRKFSNVESTAHV